MSGGVKEATACGNASIWWASWWTPRKLLHLSSKLQAQHHPPRRGGRNHIRFLTLQPQHTKAHVCQRGAKNPTLKSEEREKSDALIRSLSQPCCLSHPAAPTGVLTVYKRWEAGREPKRGKTDRLRDIGCVLHLVTCSPAHPEASPKLLVKQINK